MMSTLEVLVHLEDMLHMALTIINKQSQLLVQHGIETENGELEVSEKRFRADMEKWC